MRYIDQDRKKILICNQLNYVYQTKDITSILNIFTKVKNTIEIKRSTRIQLHHNIRELSTCIHHKFLYHQSNLE